MGMGKLKAFRSCNPEQKMLLPHSPMEWMLEIYLVIFLLDLADELDLSAILIPVRPRIKGVRRDSIRGCR
jgi:hypothetical protein